MVVFRCLAHVLAVASYLMVASTAGLPIEKISTDTEKTVRGKREDKTGIYFFRPLSPSSPPFLSSYLRWRMEIYPKEIYEWKSLKVNAWSYRLDVFIQRTPRCSLVPGRILFPRYFNPALNPPSFGDRLWPRTVMKFRVIFHPGWKLRLNSRQERRETPYGLRSRRKFEGTNRSSTFQAT